MNARPVFIEQHTTGFFGRGMMQAETPRVATEQACSGSGGDESIGCSDAAHFFIGGTVCVKHDDCTYGTHFVAGKSGNTINVLPPLRRAVTHIERLWHDPAHPGKYYIRHLAQRIADATEQSAAMPDGKWIMRPNFATGEPLSPWGTSVGYYAPSNEGDGGYSAPVRFGPGRTAYLSGFTGNNQGCTTASYPTNGISRALVRVLLSSNGLPLTRIRVMNDAGHMIGSKIIPSSAAQRVQQWHSFPVDVRGSSAITVQILVPEYTPGAWVAVSAVNAFEAPHGDSLVIPRDAKIVCLGDSWVTGDMPRADGTEGTLEREPLTACLAAALPCATVIGAGRGGDLLLGDPNYPGSGMVARFDTEVAPHQPDVVVIVDGANEGFHSPDTAAWLAGWNLLLGKAAAIGARVVIVGVPALCQAEALAPGWSNFAPNNSVKRLSAAFCNWF